jgi:hypothetical protein
MKTCGSTGDSLLVFLFIPKMPTDENKKHQLEDILSDNVSIMDTEDMSFEGSPVPVDEEAKEGFCVECKDQEVIEEEYK